MIYSDWLPPKVVEEAKQKEKQRFAAAVAAFKQAATVAQTEAASGNPNAYAAVLGQLMDDIKIEQGTAAADEVSVVALLPAEAAVCPSVMACRVACAPAYCLPLTFITGLSGCCWWRCWPLLLQHLALQLPWRPLYDMLRALYDSAAPQVKGTFLEHVQQSTLFALVARARRFFTPGAAADIWALLRPDLVFGDPMGTRTHLALGWLVLFFPTKQIPASQPGQAQAWASLTGPPTSRAVHHMLACFKVPVGTATAGCPSTISAPHRATQLFGTKLDQLLEQYCHPSNTGPWSGDLAVFLRHGVHYFMKVAVGVLVSTGLLIALAAALGTLALPQARVCGRVPGAGAAVRQRWLAWGAGHRRSSSTPLRARCSEAGRAGQFSKRDSLVSASCKALCHLSYVWPGAVLPLVLGRFQSALATATAMHQLPASISALALCVRPLLLAGWRTTEESTQQVIAEAMMAVLPGIDANDEAKTAAVFQFYTAVLSSIPALHGAAEEEDAGPVYGSAEGGCSMEGVEFGTAGGAASGGNGNGSNGTGAAVYRLPLYLDDWVDQVMERLFTLLGNLDTGPSHRGTDQQAKPELVLQSTHLGKDTMYHSFFQHLLLRLPSRLADHVVGLLGQFATGSRSLSRATEDSLTWSLVLLGSSVGGLPPDVLAPLVPRLEALVDDALRLPSRVAHNWASMVLSSLLGVLSCWCVPDRAWPQQGGLLLPNGLQLWVDRQGVGWSPPRALCLLPAVTAAARLLPCIAPGDRELLEQASYTSLLLMSPGMLEQAVGGQGRAGGKDDGAITDEPSAATAYLLAWGSSSSSSSEDAAAGVTGDDAADGAADGFVGQLMREEARVHREAASARAAAAAGTEDEAAEHSSRPAAGSWGSDWRWRRRTSPMTVMDRLRRMLLWRCAQAAAKAAPPALPGCEPVSPGEAAAGSATPAGAVRLQQLPQEYVALFQELLVLSMQPNAGVRGSAVPTLLACVKRFPCLVELLVPEVLAALAGVPGPVLGSVAQESANDGRVAGACTVLTGCLDAWRVIFRDGPAFRGFLYALMASRCHTSNTCLKSIQMLMMQPPAPHARPPPSTTYPHTRAMPHAASDMLLLRQVGGSGLWLLMAQMAAGRAAGNPALLAELKQALSAPGLGEQLMRLLVLDHAKLDAAEAAKGGARQRRRPGRHKRHAVGPAGHDGRGGAGCHGGRGGRKVRRWRERGCCLRCDRWPAEGGRPTATTDGLFEVAHARLVRLMALLCPAELSAALREPLASRLAAYPTPSGPQEKAEVAAAAETLAGLLAAAAPAAAAASGGGGAGGGGAGWAASLLREALAGSSLEMSDAWSAALWYILDHLIPAVMEQQQQQQGSSGSGNSSNGGAVVVQDAMEEEGVETLDASGGSAASPAAVMLQQVVSAVMSAVQGSAAASGAGDAAAAGAAVTGVQGSGASAPGALPSDLKRLKYLIHCLPAIRRQGTLGNAYASSILAPPTASNLEPDAATAHGRSQAAVAAAAAAAAAQVRTAPGLIEAV
ncbi:hypothetical protein COO60DRAFT_1625449, partial [Scenedesmus sp. NREL 46B-D3]